VPNCLYREIGKEEASCMCVMWALFNSLTSSGEAATKEEADGTICSV
jgi:hypothetical protein